jgi:hypothetical protein
LEKLVRFAGVFADGFVLEKRTHLEAFLFCLDINLRLRRLQVFGAYQLRQKLHGRVSPLARLAAGVQRAACRQTPLRPTRLIEAELQRDSRSSDSTWLGGERKKHAFLRNEPEFFLEKMDVTCCGGV